MNDKKGVINFDDINKKKSIISEVDNKNEASKKLEDYKKEYEKLSEEEKEQIEYEMQLITVYGHMEISLFKQYLDEFIKKVGELALFKGFIERIFVDGLKNLCEFEFLDTVVIPIFNNKKEDVPYLDEETFNKIRREMIKSMIKKYINKNKKK